MLMPPHFLLAFSTSLHHLPFLPVENAIYTTPWPIILRVTHRFTIYKVHKASKKKREKSSAKKERKATKTLAIVLGKFKLSPLSRFRPRPCALPYSNPYAIIHITFKPSNRCLPVLLAAILQLQHHGRHVRQVQERLPTWAHRLHDDHLAGLHQQLCEPGYLHNIQSRVSQGLQEDHAHGVIINGEHVTSNSYSNRQLDDGSLVEWIMPGRGWQSVPNGGHRCSRDLNWAPVSFRLSFVAFPNSFKVLLATYVNRSVHTTKLHTYIYAMWSMNGGLQAVG